jgi:hypothetical protein
MGIVILTMNAKPALSFLLLITLTHRPSSCYRLAWHSHTHPATNVNLYAKTDNVKRKVVIPTKNSVYPQKAPNLREKTSLSYK